jgi:hypothetical protein
MQTYTFCDEEIIALDNLRESTEKLLEVTTGITAKIIKYISIDEAQEILMLQEEIRMIYTNYSYHLPSAKPFENWLREKAKVIIENYR